MGNDASTTRTASTAQGGTILLASARVGGGGILVDGSSELRALVDANAGGAGGNVTLQTAGANIAVNESTIQASGTNSQVLFNVANNTPGNSGTITLTSATVSAEILKVQALGRDGMITISGNNSALTGNTQLLLFAGSGANPPKATRRNAADPATRGRDPLPAPQAHPNPLVRMR